MPYKSHLARRIDLFWITYRRADDVKNEHLLWFLEMESLLVKPSFVKFKYKSHSVALHMIHISISFRTSNCSVVLNTLMDVDEVFCKINVWTFIVKVWSPRTNYLTTLSIVLVRSLRWSILIVVFGCCISKWWRNLLSRKESRERIGKVDERGRGQCMDECDRPRTPRVVVSNIGCGPTWLGDHSSLLCRKGT
jgi:hypothetical protein